jgi:hypothetical protein
MSDVSYEQDNHGDWIARASKCGHVGNPDEMRDGLCVNCWLDLEQRKNENTVRVFELVGRYMTGAK